ncbi:hypothetical protein ACFWHG_34795, partial [Streptomyces microflavus]|uniref:hypothetical protein n=1 Tax=Streptomyces microflavus TaxID=1919 RepID=UPI00364D5ACC
MIVYRLTGPIDFFTDYMPLPDWLGDGAPEKSAWLLEATLARNDAAAVVRWGGDMRHLPSVSATDDHPDGGLALIVKQDNIGITFVISRHPVSWAEDECDLWHDPPAPSERSRTPMTRRSRRPWATASTRPLSRRRTFRQNPGSDRRARSRMGFRRCCPWA